MAVVENQTLEPKEILKQLGHVQLVLAIPNGESAGDITGAAARIHAALSDFANRPRTVILYADTLDGLAAENADDAEVSVAPIRFPAAPPSRFEALQPVLQASQELSAQACCLWSSAPGNLTAVRAARFLIPVVEEQFDLVVPRYTRLRYESLINSAIVYPLTRALYGQRIRFPMASDLALSANLARRITESDPKTGRPVRRDWITTFAVCQGLRVCEAELDLRLPPAADTSDVSKALVGVLDPLMADVERNVLHWQRTRGSKTVPGFGTASVAADEGRAIDVRKMIEAFQLGFRNLLEVWAPVLPPATLLQLKKLTVLPLDQFRLDDELWARCIYDFALAHRLRLMSQDHLLRAMTPLYLAWVASYALEVQSCSPKEVELRLERLCIAFEEQKPYFLSRWRWPDRFNP